MTRCQYNLVRQVFADLCDRPADQIILRLMLECAGDPEVLCEVWSLLLEDRRATAIEPLLERWAVWKSC
jgi:hypothetical protein